MRTFLIARAAKDNGAAQVILVEPDLFYSAQDRGPTRNGELEKDRDDLLDHLDDNRIADVFTTLYNCTDTQVLLAGVKTCTHENADNFVIRI